MTGQEKGDLLKRVIAL